MDQMPRRRKSQDNPYTLNKDESKGIYIVKFKDSLGINREVAVSKEIFNVFNEFELKDIMQMNEFDRHIEHSEVFENNLNIKAKNKIKNIEDEFIKKSTFEDLKNAIEMLPEIQKRRIKKYYFEDQNIYQIAKDEHISVKNVSKSISEGRNKLKKYLKKFI